MSQFAAGAAARAALPVTRDPAQMGRDWIPVLAEVPLFANLSRRHLKRIASLGRTRRFAPGTAIVRRGEAGSAFFVLLDGGARVAVPSCRPRKLGRGGFFGVMAVLDE